MFYTLHEDIVLRGWDKLPYALVRRPENEVLFLNGPMYDAVSLCDGKVDCDLPFIPEQTREAVRGLARDGIVVASERPGALTEDQKYQRHGNRYIRTVHWSITGRCNYRCKHCYMSAPEAKLGELDHRTVTDIARQIGKAGVQEVSLTGGEPLVRKDFLEIVDALLEQRIHITQFYSNGKLVTAGLLEALDRRGIHPEFNLSYDGDEGWHDWLRGIPDAGRIALDAFDLCHDMGFPTGAELCLHQGNRHLLRKSVNTLANHHCAHLKTNPVSMTDLWASYDKDYSLTTEELYDIYLDYIPRFFEDGMPLTLMLGGFFYCRKGSRDWLIPSLHADESLGDRRTVCGHARNVLYLSPEGRMLPCFSLSAYDIQREFPLISELGLEAGLSDSSYLRLIDTRIEEYFRQNPACAACPYRDACGGACRAGALGARGGTGDLMGPDPSACLMFKGGYPDRIRQAAEEGLRLVPEAP